MTFSAHDTDWMESARCRGMDPDLFTPTRENNTRLIREARSVCSQCLVRRECLEYALAFGHDVIGVWGGTSDNERKKILKNRRKSGNPSPVEQPTT